MNDHNCGDHQQCLLSNKRYESQHNALQNNLDNIQVAIASPLAAMSWVMVDEFRIANTNFQNSMERIARHSVGAELVELTHASADIDWLKIELAANAESVPTTNNDNPGIYYKSFTDTISVSAYRGASHDTPVDG